jgi:hypothetical protein
LARIESQLEFHKRTGAKYPTQSKVAPTISPAREFAMATRSAGAGTARRKKVLASLSRNFPAPALKDKV